MEERLFETSRRTIAGPGPARLECIEVEAKTIVNRVPGGNLPFDWTVNPYRGCSHACVYCFARPTHAFFDLGIGRDFETKIIVKINAAAVLRRDLRARRWQGDHIAMGTNTDPYQHAEGHYKLMPEIIGVLTELRNPFSILTKGTLILRDLPLLRNAVEAGIAVSAALSVPTVDVDLWRQTEPGTPHPRQRLAAVRRLNEAGVPCGVMMAPILPGLTDRVDDLRRAAGAAIEAGATFVTPSLLHLKPGVREEFMTWLGTAHPELTAAYEARYQRAYATVPDRQLLARTMDRVFVEVGRPAPRPDLAATPRFTWRRSPVEMKKEVVATQLTLTTE